MIGSSSRSACALNFQCSSKTTRSLRRSVSGSLSIALLLAMMALRNYTQHADLPLAQTFPQNKNADEQVVARYVPTIDPRKIDLKRVRSNTSDGMKKLAKIAETSSLLQLIRGYMSVFSELNSSVQEATQSDVGGAVDVMNGMQVEFTSLRGIGLGVSLCAVEHKSGEEEGRMVPILSREILEGIQTTRAIYRQNLYLDRQYVSTEAKPRK